MKTKISVVFGCCVVMVLAACLERTLGAINPCLVNGVRTKAAGSGIDKVDLLFIVDNSSSMAEEQAALRAQFPKLIQTLTTGERAGGKPFPAVKDLHLAVVSSSLMLPGALGSGCEAKGDDGLFQHQSNPTQDASLPGCKPSYPSYLQFQAGIDDPLATARDFACIATLGTEGCGYEHQLESGLKALWPSVELDPKNQQVIPGHTIQFVGDGHGQDLLGQGDLQNRGFLRNNPNDTSLLAIVLVSDEDDCSARTTDQFAGSFSDKPINFRCQDFPDRLWPAARYVDAFKALRPGRPDLVVFAGIVGVPARLVTEAARANVNFENPSSRNAYYDGMLADPAMQVVVASDTDLRASCQSKMGGDAYPPRRIVDVARGFGETGVIQSICQEDFAPAMDAIIEVISKRLTGVCLPRSLVRTSSGKVGCNVVWELPPPGVNLPGAPHECAERSAFLSTPAQDHAQRNQQNGAICVVKQLPVHDLTLVEAAGEEGWYYDTFSEEVLRTCKQTPQRVSFTEAATPPVGVLVNLECLNEAQRYESNRTDVVTTVQQPNIGDGCGDLKDAAGNPIAPDSACAVRLADPHGGPGGDGFDHRMFCHPTRNVCVMPCSGAGDCPPAWACDDRAETVASTRSTLRAATDNSRPSGSAICANPTCGATDTTL